MITYTLDEMAYLSPELERAVELFRAAPSDGEAFEHILMEATRRGLEWTLFRVFADEEKRFEMAFEEAKTVIQSKDNRGKIFRFPQWRRPHTLSVTGYVDDIARAFRVSELALLTRLIDENVLDSFVTGFFPLVRRVYPTLLRDQIMSIQPMSIPTGHIISDPGVDLGGVFDKAIVDEVVEEITAEEARVEAATTSETEDD